MQDIHQSNFCERQAFVTGLLVKPLPLPFSSSSGRMEDCEKLPALVSSFVDAFVDFTVSGLFLPKKNTRTEIRTTFPTPSRLVAIGDLHGDYEKGIQALSLAGILDPTTLRWSGGSTVAVQVGDVLDRGGNEIKLLFLLARLKHEAIKAGGDLIGILGNHEVMNLDRDFRYVTKEGLEEFEKWGWWYRRGVEIKRMGGVVGDEVREVFDGIPRRFRGVDRKYVEGFRARIAALKPDGPITRRFLEGCPAVVVVGDSVFVHGGLLKEHVDYGLYKINEEVRDWIRGLKGNRSPRYLRGRDSVVWLRNFSHGVNCDCENLETVLSLIPGAARMVMGHTIQREGINAVCGTQALRIDVGLSRGCTDGIPEVLEINNGREIRVLTSNLLYRKSDPLPVPKERKKKGLTLLVPDSSSQVEVEA